LRLPDERALARAAKSAPGPLVESDEDVEPLEDEDDDEPFGGGPPGGGPCLAIRVWMLSNAFWALERSPDWRAEERLWKSEFICWKLDCVEFAELDE
jgi:hypothetical protein